MAARMVTAVTLVMLICMTFRIPYGAYAALYALTISRESPQVTVSAAKTIVAAFAIGGVYVLIGSLFFVAEPVLRILWVIVSLFLSFYAVSAVANYGTATRFGYVVVVTVPLWDSFISTAVKVEDTLWAVGAIALASGITVVCELAYGAIRPGDDLIRSVAERLSAVEEVLVCYASDRPVDKAAETRLTRLAMLGTSRLRRILSRSNHPQHYREQMSALVALVGRLVDIAANMMQLGIHIGDGERQRIRALAASVASIQADLLSGNISALSKFHSNSETSDQVLLLREMEMTVAQIPEVFSGSGAIGVPVPSPLPGDRRSALFVADALSNLEHYKFGLKGCLAAGLCYLIYNALDWPGISTAVTTCLLTALTTVGASRQKQVLRFAGVVVGGGVGFGAQIFILPSVDSIVGFTVLFIAVTFVAAWIATSGPRFSYFGVQFAVSFYLIHLQEFKIQTSLDVARDRVVGVFFGLFMMWLVFDQLWAAPAATQMKKTFISNLRSLGQLVRAPLPGDTTFAGERSSALREAINANFDKVRSMADGVLFEFGSSRRPRDLALRDHIRQWQPQLRSLFVARIALLKYRLQLPGFELPEPARVAQQEFDNRIADLLDGMADRMEGKAAEVDAGAQDPLEGLEETIRTHCAEGPQGSLPAQMETFLALSRNVESVTMSLDKDIRSTAFGSSQSST
jgi:multidrug resistance protein MdtO